MKKAETNLRKLRKLKSKDLGVSIKDIAEFMGISIQHYYALERGERRLNADQINSISEILHISSNDILGTTENHEIASKLQDTALLDYVKTFIFTKLKETSNNTLWSLSEVEKYIVNLEGADKNTQIDFLSGIIKNIIIIDGQINIEIKNPIDLKMMVQITKFTVDEVINIIKKFSSDKRKAILKKIIDIN
jgi:transcriptional regulator with XRE-family HTH domain